MILIFTENVSYSARYVTRYLLKHQERFEVFLETDFIAFEYEISAGERKISILKNGEHVCFYEELKSVWAHRSEIRVEKPGSGMSEEERIYLERQWDTQVESIRHLLHQKKCLGRFGKLNFNKLVFLDVCIQLGIPIPKTLITRSKDELLTFFKDNKNGIIVKSIARNFHYRVAVSDNEQVWQHGITNEVTENKLDEIPDEFDLSLFQEKLDKKYELRIFYLNGMCFSQVIFSQKHAFSEVDYRQGLGGSEMRQCNFNLPASIREQLTLLMHTLDLNIGCIDIVVTKQNEYVFLEVNPSGIFTDMMDNCNYNMHYEIANYLMS